MNTEHVSVYGPIQPTPDMACYDDQNRPFARTPVYIVWPESWMHHLTGVVRSHRGPNSLGKRVEVVLDKPPTWASPVQEIPPERLAARPTQCALPFPDRMS